MFGRRDDSKKIEKLLDLINYVRSKPTFMAENLHKLTELFEGNLLKGFDNNLYETIEGEDAVLDSINFLENQQ